MFYLYRVGRSHRSADMRRVFVARWVKIGVFLLILGALFNVYLQKYREKQIIVQNERKDQSRIKAPTKSNSYAYSWLPCRQNKTVENLKDFRSLPDTIKDFLYTRHCHHFPILLDLPDKCGGLDKSAEVFFLLVVKSSPMNYEWRAVLRKTWAKEGLYNGAQIRRVFISGTSHSGFEKKRMNKLLELEQREHSDILQWDFHDTFYNLTLKQMLFMEWMEKNCRNVRFLLNGDDDVFANTDNMVEFLQSLQDNNGNKHLFIGHLIQNVGPIRDPWSKYFIPVQVQESDSYPPYCGGGGFLLSGYTASIIYNMSQTIAILPIDDVYMGICLAKAGLGPASHMGVKTAGLHVPSSKLDRFDPCFYRDVLLVHRFLPSHLYVMWNEIKDPNLKCDAARRS